MTLYLDKILYYSNLIKTYINWYKYAFKDYKFTHKINACICSLFMQKMAPDMCHTSSAKYLPSGEWTSCVDIQIAPRVCSTTIISRIVVRLQIVGKHSTTFLALSRTENNMSGAARRITCPEPPLVLIQWCKLTLYLYFQWKPQFVSKHHQL